jgi:hypothetical protein
MLAIDQYEPTRISRRINFLFRFLEVVDISSSEEWSCNFKTFLRICFRYLKLKALIV